MIEAFLNSVAVVDTEATSNKPDEAEILELGVSRYRNGTWETNSSLFKPTIPIPFASSAMCNITDKMVRSKPSFAESVEYAFALLDLLNTKYYVAHNAPYDMKVLNSNFNRVGVDFDVERDLGKDSWICTYKLAKRVLVDVDNIQYNQNYLRYYYGVEVDPDLYPHRAGHDTIICAHLLVKLMEDAINKGLVDPDRDIGLQLATLSWERVPVNTWPFGKNKGRKISELENGFLRWAIMNVSELDESSGNYNPDLAAAIETEINNRPNFGK